MEMLEIALASDHGGFDQKEQIKSWLSSQEYVVTDYGCDSPESVDYPDFAYRACKAVAEGKADYAILVCGTGIGMQIAANKVHGIRAANITSVDFAKLCRQHNNANVLTLSGRFIDLEDNKEIITAFLTTDFEGGRHMRRVEKIMNIEQGE